MLICPLPFISFQQAKTSESFPHLVNYLKQLNFLCTPSSKIIFKEHIQLQTVHDNTEPAKWGLVIDEFVHSWRELNLERNTFNTNEHL